MKSAHHPASATAGHRVKRKPYRSPACRPLSAGEAKALLHDADPNDPAVRQMLDRIAELLRKQTQ
jgi:hypothetical protein